MSTRVHNNTGTSSKTMVSGSERFKYFKRPIMPRVSAIPPQILLAPVSATDNNPLIPVEKIDDSTVKDVGVQTMYRESEAQTVPYTPEFIVPSGQEPELLLLKNLTYDNGLPLGKTEIEMIEYARLKRDMESNLPPFTDEASLILRKKLMEQQEMKEFKLRETEIDLKREIKLQEIHQALIEREETNEFMTSQRLENIRLNRMEEREVVLQKIRNKRIKALRRLAHQRNISDPVLSDGTGRDIINDYFDKASKVYAPARREGQDVTSFQPAKYEIGSRTVPLDNVNNIISLEHSIPKRYLDEDTGNEPLMAKTAPFKAKQKVGGGGRVAEMRLTSAASRAIRITKRDVEEMHQILVQKKLNAMTTNTSAVGGTGGSTPGFSRPHTNKTGVSSDNQHNTTTPTSRTGTGKPESSMLAALIAKKPKGRPVTPDFTYDRILKPIEIIINPDEEEELPPPPIDTTNYELKNNLEFQNSVILLQRLIRGRAVQNIMFEGKYRRIELISELKNADESERETKEASSFEIMEEQNDMRQHYLKHSTVDMVAGSVSSNIINVLAQEKVLLLRHEYMLTFIL